MSLLLANRAVLPPVGGANPMILTIDTSLGAGDTFALPLPSGQTYNFTWTPYDGASPLLVTAYNDVNASYTYASGGIYEVSIGVNEGDKCGGFAFNNGGDKLKITSVDQWGDVGLDLLASCFYGCSNLTTIPSGLIHNATSLINFAANCTSLTSFDATDYDMSSVTDLSAFIFGCGSLTILNTSNWNTPNVLTFAAFARNCTALATLDVSSLNVSSATNVSNFIFNNNALTTFDTDSWNTASITNCAGMAFGCELLTSSFDNTKWWDRAVPIGSFLDCFTGDTSITNYASIPNAWKGL